MNTRYRTYAQVNLNDIRHNGQTARKLFPNQKILSVLKADAYGHGVSSVVPAYEDFTDWYAVATVDEALAIRKQSAKPILLFGPVPTGLMKTAAENHLTFTVGSTEYAARLAGEMHSAGLTAQCHLKIDTGMNRSGIRWRNESAMEEIRQVRSHDCLEFTGTYTHFACGEGEIDWERNFTDLQFARFSEAMKAMEQEGYALGIRHCCSTGGSLVRPEYMLDMVRVGMLPLGMSYTDESVRECGLKPAMKWVSFVSQIEDVQPGEAISYGCTYRVERPMKIGIVTCGYADGYRRVYSNKSHVLVGGKKVPIVGRIAMDYLTIDLTDVENVGIGSEVILLGSDGVNSVTVLELSQYGESVSGEVTCAITARVPRIYIG